MPPVFSEPAMTAVTAMTTVTAVNAVSTTTMATTTTTTAVSTSIAVSPMLSVTIEEALEPKEPDSSMLYSYDDDDDDDDNDDEDYDDEWIPDEVEEKIHESRKEIKEKYIRPLIPVMDLYRLSIRAMHAIILAFNPLNAPSLSTVDRQIKEIRNESSMWIKDQDFPQRGVLHFDGVKVSLGAKHGNRRVEHLSITVTGLGKEFKIGIFELESSTGAVVMIIQSGSLKLQLNPAIPDPRVTEIRH